MSSLVLTVTRECNLRCSYCPTAKDGWPSLSVQDAEAAVDLFARRYGGGDIKLFGGEPLLVPEVVRGAMEAARDRPEIRRVYLSTNGLGLDSAWLDYLSHYPKGVLTISMDGLPEDHRRLRRALPQAGDSYAHVVSLMPALRRVPRVVVTQTIAPSTAKRAHQNFRHLRELGFWRFNFLPGYYIPWKTEQLLHLRAAFDSIGQDVREAWAKDEPLYVRNLFTYVPTTFFNTGLVVDSDRTIHPSNVGLSGALEGLLEETRIGSLDDPPTAEALAAKAEEVNALLERALPPDVMRATRLADQELSRLCRGLYPSYLAKRASKRSVA
ncbi:MAG: radical SAM protein [Sandaracinaceae bacterium]|nr:radical SAM protein [Sandaracinaceae bacterium]